MGHRQRYMLVVLLVFVSLLLFSRVAGTFGQADTAVLAQSIPEPGGISMPALSTAQGNTFAKQYSSAATSLDIANSIAATGDGGYIVAGVNNPSGSGAYDLMLVKLNASGNVGWSKSVSGTGSWSGSSILVSTAGGQESYIVVGSTSLYGTGGEEAWVVNLDSNGNVIWQNTFAVQYALTSSLDDWAFGVAATGDGGYVVAGKSNSAGAGDYDAWVFKLSSMGVLEWSTLYGTANADEADRVTVVQESGLEYYIVAGVTGTSSFVLKLDAGGTIVWEKVFGGGAGPAYVPSSVVPASSGAGYVVAGTRTQASDSRGWVLKLNTNGSTAWFKDYGNPGRDTIAQLSVTADGGYIAGGRMISNGVYRTLIIKLDSTGSIQWQKTYDPGFQQVLSGIVPTANGGYTAVGSTVVTSTHLWAIKVDGGGGIGACPPIPQPANETTGNDSTTLANASLSVATPASLLGTSTATVKAGTVQPIWWAPLCQIWVPYIAK